MTLDEFRQSATGPAAAPPPGLSGALQALWHEARGDWDQAHEQAQGDRTREGSWVHAYLHRKEGDAGNAGYWYARAGRPAGKGTAEEEWAAIAKELLAG
jgi:hypothetical protein